MRKMVGASPTVSKANIVWNHMISALTNRHARNANPFLHNLQPDHQLHAPARVQVSRALAREHGPVARAVARLALQLRDVADIAEFRFREGLVLLVFIAAEPAEDEARLVFAADLDEPAGRLGEPPDDGEEEEERDDLEGDGEAPADRGCTVVDVGEAADVPLAERLLAGIGGSRDSNSYNSSQYATTTPKIFRVNSMAMNWPRLWWETDSVAQTGTMAFRFPVPKPLMRRARKGGQRMIHILANGQGKNPPKIIHTWFCAEHCNDAPTMPHAAPKAIVLIRPTFSPNQPPTSAPTSVPR
jgi:hypothetical protein